jgi:peptidoglycan/xylan/chitin deacetylase (PgdA/CDA1 family)
MLAADGYKFDPARDGFGFRNPVGELPNRTGGGRILRRFDPLLYGRGLCFGMATAALLYFADRATDARRPPLAELSPTPALLDILRKYHVGQYGARAVFATLGAWVASGGGRPERVLGRLRLVGASPDPHVLCFGPALNRRFLSYLVQAHAVVPYRVEEERVYVYDPNHPGDWERFVEFRRDGRSVEFAYGGFRSREGWGITLVPVSVYPPVAPGYFDQSVALCP